MMHALHPAKRAAISAHISHTWQGLQRTFLNQSL